MPGLAPFGLREPVDRLPGVGPKTAAQLAVLGLHTVADLLLHLPFRYEDRTHLTPIASLAAEQEVLVGGRIVEVHAGARRRALTSIIEDETGRVLLRFFNAAPSLERAFVPGRRISCFGRPRPALLGYEFVHPQCHFDAERPTETGLTPVYHSTQTIRQALLRRLIRTALERMPEELGRLLPGLGVAGFATTADALRFVHSPPATADCGALAGGCHPATRRLALEELVGFELRARRRRALRTQESAPVLAAPGTLVGALRAALPFQLTAGQERALREVQADLGRAHPMRRLLQGDVGCGKTVVAAFAVAQAVDSGFQAVLMAPTELLAEQHYRSFARWFEPLGHPVTWLAGATGVRARRAALKALASGASQIVVGTHALFQQDVQFARLGLAIIDEQHRFGVGQRLALVGKGARGVVPHQLFMSATPIPRTLAQTFYADLDLSEIRGLPAGRAPVVTAVLPAGRRGEIIARIKDACRSGRQAYWVCPVIDESATELQAAASTAAQLRSELAGIEVGLVHGRMAPAEKEAVMRGFAGGAVGLLVATTVIEVGVDVPAASLMIVEHAERMGLAQLHQLRGRVGRGTTESHCLLLYAPPLSEHARARLQCLRETTDGFIVAEQDLALRGPGELFGARQAGHPVWRIADLVRDRDLLASAAVLADRLEQETPAAAELLYRRWATLHDPMLRG